ncbi:MAG TPA: phosphodiester glycosidase family protein, partial [Bacillota bacterium]|nr:phosphodiester glycosidase family protein [Bacillota bacterium]
TSKEESKVSVPAETSKEDNDVSSTPTSTFPVVTVVKTPLNETVYATTAVWLRSDWSDAPVKIKVLDKDESITRIATYDNGWSGLLYGSTEVFVKTKYLTTDKPALLPTVVMGDSHWAYEREGLSISIDKVSENGIVYFVANIYTANPSKDINTLLAGTGGTYTSCLAIKETVSVLAERAGAILAINGDSVGSRSSKSPYQNPIVIRNGLLWFEKDANIGEMMCITDEGDMFFVEGNEYTGCELLSMGVTDMFWFDGSLIKDGVNQYEGRSFTWKNPSTAIGQKDANNWIFIVVDGRGSNGSAGVDYAQMAKLMEKHGAINAGLLDGGGSSTIWFNGEVLNKPSDGQERRISDIIYIAK